MLGIPTRYLLKHPVTGVADLLADPIETWTTIREAYVEKREQRRPQCPYQPATRLEYVGDKHHKQVQGCKHHFL